METATQPGRNTSEFKAMVGGSLSVMFAFLVGKIFPDSGVDVDGGELVAALTVMVSAYTAVRGWNKAAALKGEKA